MTDLLRDPILLSTVGIVTVICALVLYWVMGRDCIAGNS